MLCVYIHLFYFIHLFIYLFIYFGCIGSSLLRAGFLQLRRAGAPLCCSSRASHCGGFSCWGTRALETRASVVVVHGLSCSAACGIFPDQGSNCVPCIGRQIRNHCATKAVPIYIYFNYKCLSGFRTISLGYFPELEFLGQRLCIVFKLLKLKAAVFVMYTPSHSQMILFRITLEVQQLFMKNKVCFIYFQFLFYLFIYLVAPGLSCGSRAPLVAARQLLSCSTQAPQLWHVNSQLWHACGIWFPEQGLNLRSPALGARSLIH